MDDGIVLSAGERRVMWSPAADGLHGYHTAHSHSLSGLGHVQNSKSTSNAESIEACLEKCLHGHLLSALSIQSALVPLPTVMNGLMMNGVLGLVCPSLLDRLLPGFERVDAPSCRVGGASELVLVLRAASQTI